MKAARSRHSAEAFLSFPKVAFDASRRDSPFSTKRRAENSLGSSFRLGRGTAGSLRNSRAKSFAMSAGRVRSTQTVSRAVLGSFGFGVFFRITTDDFLQVVSVSNLTSTDFGFPVHLLLLLLGLSGPGSCHIPRVTHGRIDRAGTSS